MYGVGTPWTTGLGPVRSSVCREIDVQASQWAEVRLTIVSSAKSPEVPRSRDATLGTDAPRETGLECELNSRLGPIEDPSISDLG